MSVFDPQVQARGPTVPGNLKRSARLGTLIKTDTGQAKMGECDAMGQYTQLLSWEIDTWLGTEGRSGSRETG